MALKFFKKPTADLAIGKVGSGAIILGDQKFSWPSFDFDSLIDQAMNTQTISGLPGWSFSYSTIDSNSEMDFQDGRGPVPYTWKYLEIALDERAAALSQFNSGGNKIVQTQSALMAVNNTISPLIASATDWPTNRYFLNVHTAGGWFFNGVDVPPDSFTERVSDTSGTINVDYVVNDAAVWSVDGTVLREVAFVITTWF